VTVKLQAKLERSLSLEALKPIHIGFTLSTLMLSTKVIKYTRLNMSCFVVFLDFSCNQELMQIAHKSNRGPFYYVKAYTLR